MSLRILVCGGRDYGLDKVDEHGETVSNYLARAILFWLLDGAWEEETLGHLLTELSEFTLIQGGAKGADALAAWWADNSPMHGHNENEDQPKFEHKEFPADWNQYHKAAGPIRNKQMLDEGKPDVVVAFTEIPLAESKGTRDMVEQAVEAGVPTFVVQYMNPPENES